MNRGRKSGYTLIELLIVVAILAIMAAASMKMIVGPMQAERFASIEHGQQAGASTILARLVEEAHSATALQPLENGLVLQGALPGEETSVRYQVDNAKHLRRTVVPASGASETSGTALLDEVQSFTAEPATTAGLWTVHVTAAEQKYGRNVAIDRKITLAVGTAAWAGQGVAP